MAILRGDENFMSYFSHQEDALCNCITSISDLLVILCIYSLEIILFDCLCETLDELGILNIELMIKIDFLRS